MDVEITKGAIELPIGEETVTVQVAISYGTLATLCRYCQKNWGNLISVAVTPNDTELGRTAQTLMFVAFLNGSPVCVECFDRWQEETESRLTQKIHGKWLKND